MFHIKRIRFFMVGLLLPIAAIHAQNAKPLNVVTTAVPFLRIPSDARAGGMGEVGIATEADVNAVFWNLGKLPFNAAKGSIGVNYTPWLREMANDMYHLSLNGTYRLNEGEVVYAGLCYFNLGDLQFTDNNGNHLQAFHPREWSIAAGYARQLSQRSGVGIGLQFIYSDLASKGVDGNLYKPGKAVAADLGYYFNGTNERGTGWSLGAALRNLGSKISYTEGASQKDYIPANLGLGVAYHKTFDEQNKITFAVDVNKLLVPTPPPAADSAALVAYRNKSVVSSWFSSFSDAPGGLKEELKEFQLSFGTEYWYSNQFALRGGYFWEHPAKGDRRYFTLGAGIKYNQLAFDFSYVIPAGNTITKSPLTNTLRFGLVITN